MEQRLVPYRRMPLWTAASLPTGFRRMHNTKEGTWAKLTVLQGQLTFFALDAAGAVQSEQVFSPDNPAPFIEPQAWHKVEPSSEDLRCVLEFYCEPERYYEKKYGLTAPHSEVIEVLRYIQQGNALDLGCGRGRNSIFLARQGFAVTAMDHSEAALAKLRKIIAAEQECRGIQVEPYDISKASIELDYDLIVSTVVLQFLPADSIKAVIENMQRHTRPGGINLVVAPLSTEDFPCPIEWPFTFGDRELQEYYDGWTLHKYDESIGTFHRLDENGDRYQGKFATLIARR